jgi:1-acyl-sn-glycerol-3-phosphate acyltransferase
MAEAAQPAAAKLEVAKPAVEVSPFYRAVRGLLQTALGQFYRTIEITGRERIDPSVPTILACNHPNSIIDPLLLGSVEERQVCFCARDGLFKVPGFGQLLWAMGAVPLQRRSDHAGGAVDNSAAFAACRKVLVGGGVLAIFPEGKTHSGLRIEPLKTGTVRIALDAVAAKPDLGLRIVPVGITYLVRHAFLSDVHVAVGEPIDVSAAVASHGSTDPVETVKLLTEEIGRALRALSVHVEDAEDERLIAQITTIITNIRAEEGLDEGGQSPSERTALVQRIIDAYRWATANEPEQVVVLRQRIEEYMAERAELGLGGERPALQHRSEHRLSGWRGWALLVLGAPVAAYGLLVSLPPYLLLRAGLSLVRLSTYRVALFKLLGGVALFGVCWTAAVAGVGMAYGTGPAAFLALTLLPAALFAHRYMTETRLHRLHLRSLDAWRQRHRLARLQGERKVISEALADLRRRYLAKTEPAAAP